MISDSKTIEYIPNIRHCYQFSFDKIETIKTPEIIVIQCIPKKNETPHTSSDYILILSHYMLVAKKKVFFLILRSLILFIYTQTMRRTYLLDGLFLIDSCVLSIKLKYLLVAFVSLHLHLFSVFVLLFCFVPMRFAIFD